MNILVYDVAANGGGGTTVLEYFYNMHRQDKNNHYYYVLSVIDVDEIDNVSVIKAPYVQTSWFHRIYFDLIGSRRLLRKFQIDRVLSLQNTVLPSFKGEQTVYVHNALPFSEHRFKFHESKYLWIYQNIIGKVIIKSIKQAKSVIVQTEWMKKRIEGMIAGAGEKIIVSFPEVQIIDGYRYEPQKKTKFFYPANPSIFKNHRIIYEACKVLVEEQIQINQFSITFTLTGEESEEIAVIKKQLSQIGICCHWVGTLSREQMFQNYAESVLLFPSYIETVGLPIYEAKMVGCPLILADCAYSREVANDYGNVNYFASNDAQQLADIMIKYLSK